MSPFTAEMTPYDMLRSILQDSRSDEELETILEANGYDFGQTITSIMEAQGMVSNVTGAVQPEPQSHTYLVGKSMSPSSRPITPAGQQKSPIICRYWLASGHCARADCRFAHEVQNHICKYWMQGNCIAGNSCLFSHDPSSLMQQLNLTNSGASTPQQFAPNFSLQDYDSFPALQPTTSNPYEETNNLDPNTLAAALQQQQAVAQPPPGLFPTFVPTGPRHGSRPGSRPGSRHTSRAPTPNQPNFQDDEAFPTLGSAAANKPGKRHHGKRGGHGHRSTSTNNNPLQPSNLADIVRMTPSPARSPEPNSKEALRRGLRNNRSFTSTREHSAASNAIPPPTDIPWLETGASVNQAYMRARAEAFKHGGLRNKFLQSAAQAWNRNDARGAKALSLRGQNENALMREKHREAARWLYEERNALLQKQQRAGGGASEGKKDVFVDLHGLHPEEAVSYLSACLKEQAQRAQQIEARGGEPRPVYAICGVGQHSKSGKDKVGRAVQAWLSHGRYAFREFGTPGEGGSAGAGGGRGSAGMGGILGIDPRSYDKEAAQKSGGVSGDGDSGVGLQEGVDTKVLVAKEDPRKATAAVKVEEE